MWELILPRTVPGCLYAVIWAVHHRRCPSDFYHGPQQHCSLGQWCHPPARKQITHYSTHCFIWMSTTARLHSYFHSFWHPVCRHPSGSLRTLHDMSWMFTFLFSSMTTFLKEKELLHFAYTVSAHQPSPAQLWLADRLPLCFQHHRWNNGILSPSSWFPLWSPSGISQFDPTGWSATTTTKKPNNQTFC